MAARWDIFCNVVDNYGDAGVAWRLARILASEHALDVTLWIDALAPLARIAPAVRPQRDTQRVDGVTVRRLEDPPPPFEPADVIVDAFVGGIPDRYVEAMAARRARPRWFRLEYLALESALEAHHGLPSPHPRLPLARAFWLPGFTARSGGLLRERGLLDARDAFARDAGAQRALWAALGVAPPAPGDFRVSMFCYPEAPLDRLLAQWSGADEALTVIVPEGVAPSAIERFTGAKPRSPGEPPFVQGNVAVASVPFVAQDVYDRLLWACDLNFVRGEDSFVRAQWAAKPFVWHAYAQSDDAHAAKISAFIERYTARLDARTAGAVRGMFGAWNALSDAPAIEPAWRAFASGRLRLRAHATRWSRELAALPELAAGLVKSTENAL
jgi:uncharacterized repeat protein (TIGR03837 family)